MNPRRLLILLPALMIGLLTASPLPAAERRDAKDDPVTRDARGVANVAFSALASAYDAADREREAMLRALVSERRAIRPDLAVRALKPLGRREAIMAALDYNYDVAIARRNPERAKTFLAEAEAVFDPLFDIQISYGRQDTYRRTRFGTVRPKTFVPQGNEAINYANDVPFSEWYCSLQCRENINKLVIERPTPTSPAVVAFEFYENTNTDPVPNTAIDTSPGRSFGHPKAQHTVTIGITQNLPWGGSLTLTDQTIQQYVYYRRGFEWPGGQWTTNLTGSINMPLPYTKGFGQSGANAIQEKKARVAAERADHDFDRTIQTVLRDTEAAYFDLVQAGEALTTTVQNEQLVKRLRDRMTRLYAREVGTRYQLAQLDAEVSRAGLDVERAIESYVAASIRLGSFVGNNETAKGRVLYLPIAYRHALETPLKVPSLKQAWEEARRSRPELLIAALDQRTAELNAAQASNETRPDLAFNGSTTSGQKGDTYGYLNPIKSHQAIADPDTLTQSMGLTFTRPWGNNAAVARAGQARMALESQELGTRASDASVKRELVEALTGVQTATNNERSASRQAKALRDAYDSYERSLEVGLAGEDEIIDTLRRYMSAEVARTAALANRRRAENNLLFAQGIIAAVLPAEVAGGKADRERLNALLRTGRLQHFAAPTKKDVKADTSP